MSVIVNNHEYFTTEGEMRQHLQPIPTIFGDDEFRSRNEVRWAVIFDRLDLNSVYEPEGIRLPSGEKYLPDFYIKDSGYLVDAKSDGLMDPTMRQGSIREFMKFLNDPENKGIPFPGYENYPINGLLVTPPKVFINDPTGPYGYKHKGNKRLEQNIYNFSLKLMGVSKDDKRFEKWARSNPNFEHVRRAVNGGIRAKFEHGEAPSPIGMRNRSTDQQLKEWYGTTSIGQHSSGYVWSHFDKWQLKPLLDVD